MSRINFVLENSELIIDEKNLDILMRIMESDPNNERPATKTQIGSLKRMEKHFNIKVSIPEGMTRKEACIKMLRIEDAVNRKIAKPRKEAAKTF